MGKSNKLRHARRQQAESNVCALLAAHSRRKSKAAVAVSYGDFAPPYRAKIEACRTFALRRPEDWRCRLKSRSEERRFLDLVRFAFAKYPAPAHLERVWIATSTTISSTTCARASAAADSARLPISCAGTWSRPRADRCTSSWRIRICRSSRPTISSLPRTNSPPTAPSGTRWRGRRATIPALRSRFRRLRLSDFSVASTFWRDVARFFARNPTTIAEMNNLVDFIRAAKEEDDGFALKGRTLPALRRRMEEWHRALQKQQAICGGSWTGAAIPDVEYRAGRDDNPAIWRFRQIKTGNGLFREGQRMHHCVASYKSACVSGDLSIWSVTCEYPLGHINKGVTIELRKDGAIVQCRGTANRLPHADEAAIVKHWARERGLSWQALER